MCELSEKFLIDYEKHLPLRLSPLPLQRGKNSKNQKQLHFNLSPPFEGAA
jgi:hypothetical protein